ncbi:hypothetical protein Tco_0509303 [Tanacetum coccineum]
MTKIIPLVRLRSETSTLSIGLKKIYEVIERSIETKSIHSDFQLRNLGKVICYNLVYMAPKEVETSELKTDAVRDIQDLYDVIMDDLLGGNMSFDFWAFEYVRNEVRPYIVVLG